MTRGIVKCALVAALCSLPGIAGAEVERDTDKDAVEVRTDAARIFRSESSEIGPFRCADLPPGPYDASAIWENNLYGLRCGAFSYLGGSAWPWVAGLSANRYIAVYAVGDSILIAPWPLNLSRACVSGIRFLSTCPW